MGSIGIWQLLIIAVIVMLLFGTKKLGSIGSDLGTLIKDFKKAINDDDNKQDISNQELDSTDISVVDKQGDIKNDDSKSND